MKFEDVKVDQRVRIVVPTRKRGITGTVVARERLTIAGRERERVYVDTDNPRGRRVCAPSVLEVLDG